MPGRSGLELPRGFEEGRREDSRRAHFRASKYRNGGESHEAGRPRFSGEAPFHDKLLVTVENALRLSRLEDENRELRHRLGKHELIVLVRRLKKLIAQIDRVAASETRVCILGETGTGKELVARAIHEKSPRREHPFITLNCAAVPAELIESELFDTKKAPSPGAAVRHVGKFETSRRRDAFSG